MQLRERSLLRFEIPVDDSERVKVFESEDELSQIELDVFFSEHHLREERNERREKRGLTSLDNRVNRSPPLRKSRMR